MATTMSHRQLVNGMMLCPMIFCIFGLLSSATSQHLSCTINNLVSKGGYAHSNSSNPIWDSTIHTEAPTGLWSQFDINLQDKSHGMNHTFRFWRNGNHTVVNATRNSKEIILRSTSIWFPLNSNETKNITFEKKKKNLTLHLTNGVKDKEIQIRNVTLGKAQIITVKNKGDPDLNVKFCGGGNVSVSATNNSMTSQNASSLVSSTEGNEVYITTTSSSVRVSATNNSTMSQIVSCPLCPTNGSESNITTTRSSFAIRTKLRNQPAIEQVGQQTNVNDRLPLLPPTEIQSNTTPSSQFHYVVSATPNLTVMAPEVINDRDEASVSFYRENLPANANTFRPGTLCTSYRVICHEEVIYNEVEDPVRTEEAIYSKPYDKESVHKEEAIYSEPHD